MCLWEGGRKTAILMTEGGLGCSKEAGLIKESSSTCASRWRVPADWLLKENNCHPSLFPNEELRPEPHRSHQYHGELPAPGPIGTQLGSLSRRKERNRDRE